MKNNSTKTKSQEQNSDPVMNDDDTEVVQQLNSSTTLNQPTSFEYLTKNPMDDDYLISSATVREELVDSAFTKHM